MERTLSEQLSFEAAKRGFPISGWVNINAIHEDSFKTHLARYDTWLSEGNAAEMDYLRRGRDRRADPTTVFPQAKSVFCVGSPYPYSETPVGHPMYAHYLSGEDYHSSIERRLTEVLSTVKEQHPHLEWKICIDHSAVLERTWGYLAGLGWIGKNTMLIHPQWGSLFFIGLALINTETPEQPEVHENFCGPCRRCLEACPTGAFTQSGIDSKKCISYWTIEKRGDLNLSREQVKAIDTKVAGCDICQDVCPFNRKRMRSSKKSHTFSKLNWIESFSESAAQYKNRVQASSLSRIKAPQFIRNLRNAYINAIEGNLEAPSPKEVIQTIDERKSTEMDPLVLEELEKTKILLQKFLELPS